MKGLEKDTKGRIKKQYMQRKHLGFFCHLFIQFKNRKKRGTVHSKRDAKKSDFFKGDHFLMESTLRGHLFSQKWCINW